MISSESLRKDVKLCEEWENPVGLPTFFVKVLVRDLQRALRTGGTRREKPKSNFDMEKIFKDLMDQMEKR